MPFGPRQAFAVFNFVWNYALPVTIFAYCYGRIFHTIRRQKKVVAGHDQNVAVATTSRDQDAGQVQQQVGGATGDNKLSRTEMNVLQTMIAVIVCFIVCFAPESFANFIQLLTL